MDAAAALSLFKREGLLVEVLDELHWRIMPIAFFQRIAPDRGYLFWPATGYWRRGQPWRGFREAD